MTLLLWVGIGVSLGACILHGLLGAMRPRSAKHASFAMLMALQGVYLYFQYRTYRAESMQASIAAVRATTGVALGMTAVFPWFTHACTGARLPRAVLALLWAAVGAALVYDLVSPYGIYFGAPPRFTRMPTFTGEMVGNVVAPLSVALVVWIVITFGVMAWSLAAGIASLLRDRRRTTLMFVPGNAVILVAATVDLVRDLVGGHWPYLFEYAMTIFALAMSADLAVQHRAKQRELARALAQLDAYAAQLEQLLAASLSARDQLNTPLQSLELGLALLDERLPDRPDIARLRRAVARLTEIGRLLQATPLAARPPGPPAKATPSR